MKKKTTLCPGVMLIVFLLGPVVRANLKDLSPAVRGVMSRQEPSL